MTMPRIYSEKYPDFAESAPMERRGKVPPHGLTKYIDITCPHCNNVCAEIPEHLLKPKKASMCLQHLRACEAFKANGGVVALAPDKNSELDKLKAKVASMEGDIGQLWAILGGGDPEPTTMVELKARLPQKMDEIGTKRMREEELSNDLDWTDKEEKTVKALIHPDKDAQHSEPFNRWRTHVRDNMLEANK